MDNKKEVAFNVGDVVRLRSGGPKMTVTKVVPVGTVRAGAPRTTQPLVECAYFIPRSKEAADDGEELDYGEVEFPPEALERV